MFRKSVIVAACLLVLGWAAAQPTKASDGALFSTQISFSRPVALPGVDLDAGTYVFERPLEGVANLVRVRSVDGRRIFLTALTERVNRPAGLSLRELVTFDEARSGEPRPIQTWWPPTADHGYTFRYDPR